MKVTYRISEADYLEAQKAFRKFAMPMLVSWRRNFMLGGIIVFTLIVILMLILHPDPELLLNVFPFFIFAALALAALIIAPKFQAMRRYAKDTSLQHEQTADIFEDHLVFQTSVSRSELKWDAFTSYLESPNLFLLFQSTNVFNVLPKRAFGPGEAEQFFNILTRKLPMKTRIALI